MGEREWLQAEMLGCSPPSLGLLALQNSHDTDPFKQFSLIVITGLSTHVYLYLLNYTGTNPFVNTVVLRMIY